VGFAEALRWLDELNLDAVHAAEQDLTAYALERLEEVDGLRLFGPPAGEERGGILSFELEGVHPHDVSEILDRHGVAVRAGHHCAQPLMERLGVPATTRASLAVYNTRHGEIDRLVEEPPPTCFESSKSLGDRHGQALP
jgi:cysteine desulfurase/selenocysteine lyase